MVTPNPNSSSNSNGNNLNTNDIINDANEGDNNNAVQVDCSDTDCTIVCDTVEGGIINPSSGNVGNSNNIIGNKSNGILQINTGRSIYNMWLDELVEHQLKAKDWQDRVLKQMEDHENQTKAYAELVKTFGITSGKMASNNSFTFNETVWDILVVEVETKEQKETEKKVNEYLKEANELQFLKESAAKYFMGEDFQNKEIKLLIKGTWEKHSPLKTNKTDWLDQLFRHWRLWSNTTYTIQVILITIMPLWLQLLIIQ
jgi:hypothetical protein